MRTTIRDIAREAGVSPATASQALRGVGEVAEKTRLHVVAVAERLKYRPNPILASLASKRFRDSRSIDATPIAALEFWNPSSLIPPFRFYQPTIESETRILGYSLIRIAVSADTDPSLLSRQLFNRSVQGIIILGDEGIDRFIRNFDWGRFSVVQCARFKQSLPFHSVRANIFQATKLIFSKVVSRGYQRIGFAVGTHFPMLEDDEARLGAALAMQRIHLPARNRLSIFRGRVGKDESHRQFLKWLETSKPDAVISFSPSNYWILKDAGWSAPDAIGFASMHLGDADRVGCSGLDQQREEIGRQSVRLLDQLIRYHEKGIPQSPHNLLIDSIWKEGSTLRPTHQPDAPEQVPDRP